MEYATVWLMIQDKNVKATSILVYATEWLMILVENVKATRMLWNMQLNDWWFESKINYFNYFNSLNSLLHKNYEFLVFARKMCYTEQAKFENNIFPLRPWMDI